MSELGSSLRSMPRLAMLVFACLVISLLAATAWAQSDPDATGTGDPGGADPATSSTDGPPAFAKLTIIPHGSEVFDIGTGTTTLPEGGEVVDAATGIRLVADFIEIQEGEWLRARLPVVRGTFGELTAASLELDLEASRLTAEGPVTLAREGLVLEADAAIWDGTAGLVRFEAPRSAAPSLDAAQLILHSQTGDVLLVGPYRFQDGMFTLSSQEPGSLLGLFWSVVDDVGAYDARTDLTDTFVARFAPLLEGTLD